MSIVQIPFPFSCTPTCNIVPVQCKMLTIRGVHIPSLSLFPSTHMHNAQCTPLLPICDSDRSIQTACHTAQRTFSYIFISKIFHFFLLVPHQWCVATDPASTACCAGVGVHPKQVPMPFLATSTKMSHIRSLKSEQLFTSGFEHSIGSESEVKAIRVNLDINKKLGFGFFFFFFLTLYHHLCQYLLIIFL